MRTSPRIVTVRSAADLWRAVLVIGVAITVALLIAVACLLFVLYGGGPHM
jgi:hypothetical protein